MNILILVNPAKNYKSFFFNLSRALKEQGHTTYFAYDSKKSTITTPIPEIDNSSQSFYFDEYLKKNLDLDNTDLSTRYLFECTWGEYFYSDFDRFLTHKYNRNRDRSYWLKVRVHLDNFFHETISTHNIDLVLYENISNSFEYSAYKICKLLNKRYFGLIASRIPGRYEIQSSIINSQLSELNNSKLFSATEEELTWFNNYKDQIIMIEPDYMKQNGLDNVSLTKYLNIDIIKKLYTSIHADIKYGTTHDYASGSRCIRYVSSIKTALSRKINSFKSKKYFLSNLDIDICQQTDSYYVYPMHYHPESSTSVLAPEYTDEFHNILNISNNLPFGTYLYVKDHKSALGIHNIEFYEKVSMLPAVKLINCNYNIKKLLQSSKGLITVNSTAGYEALLLHKPVYLLGKVFYQNFSNVTKLENFHSLKDILKQQTHKPLDPMDFISYKRITYDGILNFNLKDYESNIHFYNQLAINIQYKYDS